MKKNWHGLARLFGGLVLYGFSMALMVRAGLGTNPWDVFHAGASVVLGVSFGTVTAMTGVAVLLLWVPLRQRPGFGTLANVVVIAVAVDGSLAALGAVVPERPALPLAAALTVSGVVLNALATVLYIGAGMGPGPRDGLMTGLVARTGGSVRVVRSGIEAAVLAAGWLLGGTVGAGTVAYALGVGPLVQRFARVRWLRGGGLMGRGHPASQSRAAAAPANPR